MSAAPHKSTPNKSAAATASAEPSFAAATVQDVARLAGVSASTVSRTLNASARVSSDKRLSVERAIAQLKFKPDLSARSLRTKSTNTIGILTQDLESPYFTGVMRGIEEGLANSQYSPLVVPGHWNPTEEHARAQLLLARKVDAVIFLNGRMPDAQVLEIAERLPVAVSGRNLSSKNVFSVVFDQVNGGKLATSHLLALGHRHIAHITGLSGHADAQDRLTGFMLAHKEAGLSVDPRLIIEGDYREHSGEAAVKKLLAGPKFSAIFCCNDQTLWGARQALHEAGLDVPGDVSLVGFDDLPHSYYMTPALTTVRQPITAIGKALAIAVRQKLNGEEQTEPDVPELELIVRGTTAPPKTIK